MTETDKITILSREYFTAFVKAVNPAIDVSGFHKTYYRILDHFAKGRIKKLIISMPPQHGKSVGSTINLPAYILGLNPDLKIAITSYNTVFAQKFNRSVQRLIDSKNYRLIFPNTSINAKNVVTTSSYLRNATEFEVINKKGGLKAVGRGGGLTGHTVDIMIMDDLYKDKMEGNSPTVREAAWDWYTAVARTRLHNSSQELIVFTRWHEDDIVGRIEAYEQVIEIDDLAQIDEINPEIWVKINFPAIQNRQVRPIDRREMNEPLWPKKHDLKKLEKFRALDPSGFESLYQGDPKPLEGLMYSILKTYDIIPRESGSKRLNYTDTADKGSDYLCSVCYVATSMGCYITDVLYTKKPMEFTEQATADMLTLNEIQEAIVESNNGGRGFKRAVARICISSLGNITTKFTELVQRSNKESRILTASAAVQNIIFFPSDWEKRWPEFARDVKNYRKEGRNAHDDAPDVLTGIVEQFQTRFNGYTPTDAEILASFS